MVEDELKERLVQKLFEDMLTEEGFEIHKLDYEGAFQNIVNLKQDRKYPEFLHDIQKHKHDFLVKLGDELLFVHVKYSSNPVGFRKLKFDSEMGNAVIVFVTPSDPCFKIAYVNEFSETGTLRPISNNEIIQISERTAEKYSKTIRQRFT
jgi:hypothetical protein